MLIARSFTVSDIPTVKHVHIKGLFGTASPAPASSTVAHCSGVVARSRRSHPFLASAASLLPQAKLVVSAPCYSAAQCRGTVARSRSRPREALPKGPKVEDHYALGGDAREVQIDPSKASVDRPSI